MVPEKLTLSPLLRRQIEADFCGGHITSEAGLLLLREVDKQHRLAQRLSSALNDFRKPGQVRLQLDSLLLTLLEAMRVRTPVVITPGQKIPNALGHGKFGYLPSDISETSVVRALAELLASPSQACEKARLAYERFLAEYTSDQMNERYRTLYREVLTR